MLQSGQVLDRGAEQQQRKYWLGQEEEGQQGQGDFRSARDDQCTAPKQKFNPPSSPSHLLLVSSPFYSYPLLPLPGGCGLARGDHCFLYYQHTLTQTPYHTLSSHPYIPILFVPYQMVVDWPGATNALHRKLVRVIRKVLADDMQYTNKARYNSMGATIAALSLF